MVYLDLLFLFFGILSSFYCSFVLIRLAFSTPLPKFYLLLGISILSLGVSYLLIIPIIICEFSLLSPNYTFILSHSQGIMVLRVSQFFAIFFVFSFTMITFVPQIKVNTESIVIVILTTMFSTATYVTDVTTIVYVIKNDKIFISYSNIGAIFLTLSLTMLVLVLMIRFQEIRIILTKKETNPNLIANKNFYLLIFLTIISFLVSRLVDFMPAYLWAGCSSIGLLYLLFHFKKDRAFYFVSNAKLEAIIVLNTVSGKIQFYRNFQHIDMLISGVMIAFNISIKNLISSQTDIRHVSFEDKTLLMKTGEFTSTILFVTEKSIISESISSYLAKKFEFYYYPILEQNPFGVDNLKLFQAFNNDINQIVTYFSI